MEFGKQKLNSDSGFVSHFFAKPNVSGSGFSAFRSPKFNNNKMIIKKLHYAKLDLQGDISCYELNGIEEVRNFVSGIVGQHPTGKADNMVYLIAIQDNVFVTENCQLVQELFDGNLNSAYPFFEGEDIFIQEYPSYEEAYKVALDMKEVSPLCYSL